MRLRYRAKRRACGARKRRIEKQVACAGKCLSCDGLGKARGPSRRSAKRKAVFPVEGAADRNRPCYERASQTSGNRRALPA